MGIKNNEDKNHAGKAKIRGRYVLEG